MSIHLLIHNIGAIVSAVVALGVAFFLFINGKKKTANITFALVFLTTALFYVSHVIGTNIADPNLSRLAFMGNIVIFFIGAFNYHAVLATIGKDKEHKLRLASIYAIATIISVFFLFFPDLFLLPSVPKMYFVNYYEPGVLNWLRLLFLYVLLVPASIIALYKEFKRARASAEKKQLKYFIITMVVGYGVALVPNFLIYNIPVDPLWGIFFVVICAIPLAYGAVKYELFNVQVIAKQAFVYSIAVAAVGGFITLLNYSSILITSFYPNFPTWTLAGVSALLAVSASVVVWRGLRESDLLKAEFITTVTHKFRTPLTYIKWATDNLSNTNITLDERRTQLSYIRTANEKLVELTNILTTASDAESVGEYNYAMKPSDLSVVVEDVLDSLTSQFKIKDLTIERHIDSGLFAKFDVEKIKFVIQVFLENALHYSHKGGTVTVITSATRSEVMCMVSDTGVGMTTEQVNLLFSKFFRSDEARRLDTEGMGIGLYISARIIEKHGGHIAAESPGQNQGSTFSFTLPRVK